MAITRVGGASPTIPASSAATSTATKPATTASSFGFSGASSFTPAASTKSAATASTTSSASSGGHVKSNNEEVNTKFNAAIDEFAKGKGSSEATNETLSNIYSGLGLKYYESGAASAVLDSVKGFIEKNPDATPEQVDAFMWGEVVIQRQIMGSMEKKMDEALHKNVFAGE